MRSPDAHPLNDTTSSYSTAVQACVLFLALWGLTAGCDFLEGDTTPPEAPSGLTATSEAGTIELDWNEVGADDLEGYRVYRSTNPIETVSNHQPLTDSPLQETQYSDEDAVNGTTYHYVVTALDAAGNESNPSQPIQKTPFAEPPARP